MRGVIYDHAGTAHSVTYMDSVLHCSAESDLYWDSMRQQWRNLQDTIIHTKDYTNMMMHDGPLIRATMKPKLDWQTTDWVNTLAYLRMLELKLREASEKNVHAYEIGRVQKLIEKVEFMFRETDGE
jgi:hypothetical protein